MTVIRVENLGKKYVIGHQKQEKYSTLRDAISDRARSLTRKIQTPPFGKSNPSSAHDEFWALKDISFEIKQGDRVGIIGRNGAGKSTLLKILSRITEPTTGRVSIKGRVASLLEVGTGFHPELTGRENIYLNGAILGMSKAEIKKKFDEIVAFAEVEKFLDTPVKRYSSGMYVRLAFAVAAHLEPEILVVDEVLAVGDTQFQKKCLGKMEEVTEKEGRTVLFVSHNMTAVQILCTHAIHLSSGEIVGIGSVANQIEHYLNSCRNQIDITSNNPVQLGQNLQLQKLTIYPNPVISGSSAEFVVELWSSQVTCIDHLVILLHTTLGMRVGILDLKKPDSYYKLDGKNSYTISINVESLPLVEGNYSVGIYVRCGDVHKDFLDLLNLTVTNRAESGDIVPGLSSHRGVVELSYEF